MNKEVCSSTIDKENEVSNIKGYAPSQPKIKVSVPLLRKQLDKNTGGGNYFAKSSNSFTPSNPNSIIGNMGPSNAFLHVDNPTENLFS